MRCVKMKYLCKDCEEIEEFDGSEDAKDNGWHKVGAVWVCDSCWEEEYADADKDEDDEDEEDEDEEELKLNEDEKDLKLDDEDETETDEGTDETENNIIFFPVHSSLKKMDFNKKDDVWNDY